MLGVVGGGVHEVVVGEDALARLDALAVLDVDDVLQRRQLGADLLRRCARGPGW